MDSKWRKKVFWFWIGAFLAAMVGIWFFAVWRPNLQILWKSDFHISEVKVGESVFLAEVVDSPEERARGLSGRDGLEEGRGMLFLFDVPATQGFWMKEMKFPIDIIWISDGRVIGFEEDVPAPAAGVPDSELPVYLSPGAVDMVLEVDAGGVERRGIRVGDKFEVVI